MATQLINRNMRLFGLPYQFLSEVDPRVESVSTIIGRKFAENIILDAPVISIIPGQPKYLPTSKNKQTTSAALIDAGSDNLSVLKKISDEESVRFYDFERNYTDYIKYVNILCRTCAAFLEINETIDGITCQRYNYANYKWNTNSESGSTSMERTFNSIRSNVSSWVNALTKKVRNTLHDALGVVKIDFADTAINTLKQSNEILYETTAVDAFFQNYNYIQFFVDTDVSANESMSNTTSESMIKGALSSGQNMLKEVAFAMNSSGLGSESIDGLAEAATSGLSDLVGGFGDNALTGALSRVINLTDNVVKGENVIMPDIYQSSSYDKSYSFTVHLKTPYGTKFGYFMDICVPLMHLIALAIPKQTTANTYGSPFLVKAYCEGLFTCNMGIVDSIQITKGLNGAFSVDGLPTEIDVTVSIKDLYSDLSMSPQSSPILFVNNSSLIEYLATTCGLSLITPNIEQRLEMIVNAVTNAFFDIDDNIMSGITEAVDKFTMDFLGLSW